MNWPASAANRVSSMTAPSRSPTTLGPKEKLRRPGVFAVQGKTSNSNTSLNLDMAVKRLDRLTRHRRGVSAGRRRERGHLREHRPGRSEARLPEIKNKKYLEFKRQIKVSIFPVWDADDIYGICVLKTQKQICSRDPEVWLDAKIKPMFEWTRLNMSFVISRLK